MAAGSSGDRVRVVAVVSRPPSVEPEAREQDFGLETKATSYPRTLTGPCCMDHPEGCLIMVFFNTGDNLDAT